MKTSTEYSRERRQRLEQENIKELRGIYIKKDRPDIEKSIRAYADKLNKRG